MIFDRHLVPLVLTVLIDRRQTIVDLESRHHCHGEVVLHLPRHFDDVFEVLALSGLLGDAILLLVQEERLLLLIF